MRDFHRPGRSAVYATGGMAATSHPLATATAHGVLRDGGNAVDAAVAAALTLGVLEPHMTGIGGDCFVLYAPKGGGEVIGLNGSGRAPAAATVEAVRATGIAEIPQQSPHAVTVPGAVDAFTRLVADHGTKPWAELVAPAIRFAEEGVPTAPRVAADWGMEAEVLKGDASASAIYLPGGQPPKAGQVMRYPALAETLRALAERGRAGFYEGPVAQDIVNHLRSLGGLHSLDDFAATKADYVTPIRTNYRGWDVLEIPPNGQGIVALMMLNILSGWDMAALDPLSPERIHLTVEAGRLAFQDRNALIADPEKAEVPVARLLSPEYAGELRGHIRRDRAMDPLPESSIPRHRDTIYLTVVDRERNAVSLIYSIFAGFGSGLVAPKSGVLLQNRGMSFRLDPRHANAIAPNKRPMHTIIPGMLLKDGRAVMPFGVMGGHYQPFGHVQLLTNMIDHGMDVQEALDLPRTSYDVDHVVVETGVPEPAVRCLAELGHRVEVAKKPHGGGQAIVIDHESGVLTGGSDPRKDGCALGL